MARGEPARHRTGGSISIVGLRKEFDGVTAVDGIDLEIEPGEFFTLLGPSGCGKTTTLRMLAGFEQPTDGQILIDGVDVAQTPAHKRPVNTVFQSYALFPHLDVEQQRGLRTAVAQGPRQADPRGEGRQGARPRPALRVRQAPSAPAVGRAAAARRAGPGAGPRAGRAAARRAARRPRRQAPPLAARRADRPPARDRHHLRVRDARPGGGARDVEPARRHGRRPDHAARLPRGGLPRAADRVRRRLPGRRQPPRHRVRLRHRARAHGPLRRVPARGPDTTRVTPPGRAARSSGPSASSWPRRGSPAPTGCPAWSTARSSSAPRPR